MSGVKKQTHFCGLITHTTLALTLRDAILFRRLTLNYACKSSGFLRQTWGQKRSWMWLRVILLDELFDVKSFNAISDIKTNLKSGDNNRI